MHFVKLRYLFTLLNQREKDNFNCWLVEMALHKINIYICIVIMMSFIGVMDNVVL